MISLLVPTSTPRSAAGHDLGVVVPWLQSYGRFKPSVRIVEPVGKQGNPAELEDRRIVLRILGDDSCVDVASL